jgi:hypothetical protein
MPQLDAFLAEEDLHEIAGAALAAGCRVVPDLDYDQARPLELGSVDEVVRVRRERGPVMFFLVSERYRRGPLQMRAVEKSGKVVHYIEQRHGGPTVDLFAPLPEPAAPEGGAPLLQPGFLGYGSSFWIGAGGAGGADGPINLAPPELLETFAELRRLLEEGGKLVRARLRVFVVGRHALAASQEKRLALAGLDGVSAAG